MEKQVLEKYIREFGKDIFSFCRYLTQNRTEAEDLYQDIFLKAMELDCMEENRNPKGYLLGIGIRIWKNRRRKYARRKQISDLNYQFTEEDLKSKEADSSAEEMAIRREERELVRSAMVRLPEKLQVVILLFYMEEQSIENIAKILHIPSGTVKSRLHNGRKQLEKEMEAMMK